MSPKPPYRADHVGSLLRPDKLKQARARHTDDVLGDAELKSLEDELITDAVRKQEEAGLESRHRRRISAQLVAFRFPRRPRWRRDW